MALCGALHRHARPLYSENRHNKRPTAQGRRTYQKLPPSERIHFTAELAADNGETYSYVATGWGEDFETEQDEESYYENLYCEWEEVSEEEYEENRG